MTIERIRIATFMIVLSGFRLAAQSPNQPSQPVVVKNTPADPVPAIVTGSVAISGTPSVSSTDTSPRNIVRLLWGPS